MKVLERNVSKQELKDFLYYGMNIEDKQLYRQVNESQANVFQFGANTASDMTRRAVPQNFDDMVCINALSRPGASFSFNDFVRNGNDRSKYPDFISKFLKDSHGCILFQEQIMAISTECGLDANFIRGLLKKLGKASPKQSDVDKWNETVKQFERAFKEKGLTDSEIKMILDDFITLSAYSFNKSHAAAYTYVACETIYMTRYFKPYFWASSLAYDATKIDVLKTSIKNAQKDKFKILPPDINLSKVHFTPEGNGLRFGLNEVKGVGEEISEIIVKNQKYDSIIDFIVKNLDNKVNKRITIALVGSGAFDSLIPKNMRGKYLKITQDFYEKKKTKKNPEILKELWKEIEDENEMFAETSSEEFMEMEKTYLSGSFFHGIFSDDMIEKIEKLRSLNKCLRDFSEIREKGKSAYCLIHIKDLRPHTQKNGKQMVFMEVEDCNGEQMSIPMFASYYEHLKEKLSLGFYLAKVYPNENGGIVFGSSGWTSSPDTIRAMLIKYQPRGKTS